MWHFIRPLDTSVTIASQYENDNVRFSHKKGEKKRERDHVKLFRGKDGKRVCIFVLSHFEARRIVCETTIRNAYTSSGHLLLAQSLLNLTKGESIALLREGFFEQRNDPRAAIIILVVSRV